MASESVRKTGSSGGLQSALETVRTSFLLQLAVVGLGMIVAAYLLGGDVIGVWAALLPIWGGSLVVIGGGLYAILWWIRRD